MLPQRVNELLTDYRKNKGRCNSIYAEIALLEHDIETLKRNAVYDLTLKGHSLDGMPHGTGISKPTEAAAIRLAGGYLPDEAIEMQQRIKSLQNELNALNLATTLVEAWLTGLSLQERFVIQAHELDNVPWRLIGFSYEKEFGEMRSVDTLKRLKRKALQEIYAMAE